MGLSSLLSRVILAHKKEPAHFNDSHIPRIRELTKELEEQWRTGYHFENSASAGAECEDGVDAAKILYKIEQAKAAILESTQDLIIYYDANLSAEWWSIRAEEFLMQDLGGKKCYEIWGRSYEECPNCPLKRVFLTKGIEASCIKTHGRMWVVRATPIFDAAGIVIGVVELRSDISKLRKSTAVPSRNLYHKPL